MNLVARSSFVSEYLSIINPETGLVLEEPLVGWSANYFFLYKQPEYLIASGVKRHCVYSYIENVFKRVNVALRASMEVRMMCYFYSLFI